MPTDRFDVEHRVTWREAYKRQRQRLKQRIRDIHVTSAPSATKMLFVVGCGHSGTTLVSAKLGNHSKIYLVGKESYIFCPWRSLEDAKSSVLEWQEQAKREGAQFVVEKTPKHAHVPERIARIVPAANFIVVYRNPLDTVASLFSRFGDLDYAITRWLLDTRASIKVATHRNSTVCHYETLTQKPHATFERLCSELGLEFEESMLDAGKTAYGDNQKHPNMRLRQEQVQQAVVSRTGRWKEVLTQKQVDKIVYNTEKLSTQLGYELDQFF